MQALGECASVAIHNHLLLARQRTLVRGLIAAQEEERRAIAYDLHDGLTQYVMAAHSYLDTARQAQEDGNKEKFVATMDQGMHYLSDAVLESRRLVSGLRSLALDDIGLAGAVHQLCNEEKARIGWAGLGTDDERTARRDQKRCRSGSRAKARLSVCRGADCFHRALSPECRLRLCGKPPASCDRQAGQSRAVRAICWIVCQSMKPTRCASWQTLLCLSTTIWRSATYAWSKSSRRCRARFAAAPVQRRFVRSAPTFRRCESRVSRSCLRLNTSLWEDQSTRNYKAE